MDIKREIKFRAWDKLDKRWVSDVYEDEPFEIYLCGNFLGLSDCNSWVGSERYSLLQFTGLKDSTGKDIYEGDIIYVAGLGNCLVSWDKSDACWLFKQPESSYGYQDILEDIERIVGNIYENPELLEKEWI